MAGVGAGVQLLNAGVGAQRVGELRRARLADRDVSVVEIRVFDLRRRQRRPILLRVRDVASR